MDLDDSGYRETRRNIWRSNFGNILLFLPSKPFLRLLFALLTTADMVNLSRALLPNNCPALAANKKLQKPLREPRS